MQFRISGQGRRRMRGRGGGRGGVGGGGGGVTRINSETVRDSAKCFRRKISAKDLGV